MKLKFSVENLRVLQRMPDVELRPITILVGRNSSGKSTYLRSLPLLRQSIETKTSAPILWYGNLVDFGDFHSAVRENDLDNTIYFKFDINDFSVKLRPHYVEGAIRHQLYDVDKSTFRWGVSFSGQKTIRSSLSIELPKENIIGNFGFDKDGAKVIKITLNNEDVNLNEVRFDIRADVGSLFGGPRLYPRSISGQNEVIRSLPYVLYAIEFIIEKVKWHVDKRVTTENLRSEVFRLVQFSNLSNKCLEAVASQSQTKTFEKFCLRLINNPNDALRKDIDRIVQMNFLFNLWQNACDALTVSVHDVVYLGPARARSERFYRNQELEVDEISPDGRNFPIFLASLSAARLRGFSDWVNTLFAFAVEVKKTEGHISINFVRNGKRINITDTGYGVSQVLPVLAQIWWAQNAQPRSPTMHFRSTGRTKIVAIEQPELHLHPAHQAILADAFVNAVSVSRQKTAPTAPSVTLLVETHSETLVNRLGELIEMGKISETDVQIVLFGDEWGDEPHESSARIAYFNRDGQLENWPFGFFAPDL